MKNFLYIAVGFLVGTIAGFGTGIVAFPFLFPPPAVNEQIADKESKTVVAKGEFIHANPADPIHYGKGGVTIFEDVLHLETDFEVGPGPKYHVYLVPEAEVLPDTDVQSTMFIDLGRLKAFEGSQNYPIPNGVNLNDYQSVVIWCEQFNILISPATIQFE